MTSNHSSPVQAGEDVKPAWNPVCKHDKPIFWCLDCGDMLMKQLAAIKRAKAK